MRGTTFVEERASSTLPVTGAPPETCPGRSGIVHNAASVSGSHHPPALWEQGYSRFRFRLCCMLFSCNELSEQVVQLLLLLFVQPCGKLFFLLMKNRIQLFHQLLACFRQFDPGPAPVRRVPLQVTQIFLYEPFGDRARCRFGNAC